MQYEATFNAIDNILRNEARMGAGIGLVGTKLRFALQ